MGTKPRGSLERFAVGVQRRADELRRSAESETRSIPQRPAGTPNVRRIQRAVRSVSPGPGRGSLPD